MRAKLGRKQNDCVFEEEILEEIEFNVDFINRDFFLELNI